MASALFAPITLRSLALKNRIVVSPMCQYNSDNGTANDWHLMHLGQFSLGAGALVMTESTHVSAEGRISLKCAGMYSDENEAAMKRVIDFCRKYGVTAHGLQLGHAGRKGSTLPPAQGGKPLKPEEGAWQTIAPSPLPYAPDWHVPREITKADIARVRAGVVQATRRAERIGDDLVEMHAGAGYLGHEFLSPISNRRTDEYGGSLENRMRFPLETFAAMRAAWPNDKPMGVRISVTDRVEGGWDVGQSVGFSKELKKLGCDDIGLSSGALDPPQQVPFSPGHNIPHDAKVRKEAGLPTMCVGMITSARECEDFIALGKVDFVVLARAMMWNPRFACHPAEQLA